MWGIVTVNAKMNQEKAGQGTGTLDPEVIEALREDLEEVFPEFVRSFLEDVPRWLENLEKAISEGDSETLFQISHSLKSSSGYMGALALRDGATRLERIGRSGNTEGAAEVFDLMADEFDALKPRLEPMAEG